MNIGGGYPFVDISAFAQQQIDEQAQRRREDKKNAIQDVADKDAATKDAATKDVASTDNASSHEPAPIEQPRSPKALEQTDTTTKQVFINKMMEIAAESATKQLLPKETPVRQPPVKLSPTPGVFSFGMKKEQVSTPPQPIVQSTSHVKTIFNVIPKTINPVAASPKKVSPTDGVTKTSSADVKLFAAPPHLGLPTTKFPSGIFEGKNKFLASIGTLPRNQMPQTKNAAQQTKHKVAVAPGTLTFGLNKTVIDNAVTTDGKRTLVPRSTIAKTQDERATASLLSSKGTPSDNKGIVSADTVTKNSAAVSKSAHEQPAIQKQAELKNGAEPTPVTSKKTTVQEELIAPEPNETHIVQKRTVPGHKQAVPFGNKVPQPSQAKPSKPLPLKGSRPIAYKLVSPSKKEGVN